MSMSILQYQYLPSSLDVSKWIRGRVFDLHSPEIKKREKLINQLNETRSILIVNYVCESVNPIIVGIKID